MDLLYVVLRTLLICTVGLLIAFQGRRMGLSIFNLTGRLNRLQFIICFIALMILFHSWTLLFLYQPIGLQGLLYGFY